MFKSFDEIIGNKGIIPIIRNDVLKKQLDRVTLLFGEVGTGKSELAKLMARTILCDNPNDNGYCGECETCKETNQVQGSIQKVSRLSVLNIPLLKNQNKIYEVIDQLFTYQQMTERETVYILEEVQALEDKQELFYLGLTQLPRNVHLILTTFELRKLTNPFKSRCTIYKLNKLDLVGTKQLFEKIYPELYISDQLLHNMFRYTEGIPRNVIKLANQLERNKVSEQEAEQFLNVTSNQDMINLFLSGDNFLEYHKQLESLFAEKEIFDITYDLQTFLFEVISTMNGVKTSINKEVLEQFPANFNESFIIKLGSRLSAVQKMSELKLLMLAIRKQLYAKVITGEVDKNNEVLETIEPRISKEQKKQHNNEYGFKVNIFT